MRGDGAVGKAAGPEILYAATVPSVGSRGSIAPGVHRFASNHTFVYRGRKGLNFRPGAIFKPDAAVTVTIDAPIKAGHWQIFDLSAGGTVVLGPRAAKTVYPEWWGAAGDWDDATGTDDTLALQRACAAHKRVRLTRRYKVTGQIDLQDNSDLHGRGDAELRRVGTGFDVVKATRKTGVKVHGFRITGDAIATGTSATDAGVRLYACTDSSVEEIRISGQPREGIEASGAGTARLKIRGNTITGCYGHGIAVTQQYNVDVSHNIVHDLLNAGSVGLALGYSGVTLTGLICVGNIVRNCPGKGMGLNNLIGAVLEGNTITDCGLMLTANGLQDCTISGNVGRTFTPGSDFQAAMNLIGCVDNIITGNRISGVATYDGMRLVVGSARNLVYSNRISGAGAVGIYNESLNNTIWKNDIRGCGGRGITLWGASYSYVHSNRLEGNAAGGIFLGNDPSFSYVIENEITNYAAVGSSPPAIELADYTSRCRVLRNNIHHIGSGRPVVLGTGLSDVVVIE